MMEENRNDEGRLNEEASAHKLHAKRGVTSVTTRWRPSQAKREGDDRGNGCDARHKPKGHVTPGMECVAPVTPPFSLSVLFFFISFLLILLLIFPSNFSSFLFFTSILFLYFLLLIFLSFLFYFSPLIQFSLFFHFSLLSFPDKLLAFHLHN